MIGKVEGDERLVNRRSGAATHQTVVIIIRLWTFVVLLNGKSLLRLLTVSKQEKNKSSQSISVARGCDVQQWLLIVAER